MSKNAAQQSQLQLDFCKNLATQIPGSRVGDVLDKDPFQFHDALPLVLRPDRRRFIVVDAAE